MGLQQDAGAVRHGRLAAIELHRSAAKQVSEKDTGLSERKLWQPTLSWDTTTQLGEHCHTSL